MDAVERSVGLQAEECTEFIQRCYFPNSYLFSNTFDTVLDTQPMMMERIIFEPV